MLNATRLRKTAVATRVDIITILPSISLLNALVIIVQVANESKEAEKNVRILPKKI